MRDGRSRRRNPYYDSDEFKARWLSSESMTAIAASLGVSWQAVWRGALRRDLPPKRKINRQRRRAQQITLKLAPWEKE